MQYLIDKAIINLKCDDAEIKHYPDGNYFLFELHNRKADNWVEFCPEEDKYTPRVFDYVERKVVASGKTLEELEASLDFHIKLQTASKLEGWLMVFEREGFTSEQLDKAKQQMIKMGLNEIL